MWNGKIIICSFCGGHTFVYHFAWCACTCQKCRRMVDKYEHYVHPMYFPNQRFVIIEKVPIYSISRNGKINYFNYIDNEY